MVVVAVAAGVAVVVVVVVAVVIVVVVVVVLVIVVVVVVAVLPGVKGGRHAPVSCGRSLLYIDRGLPIFCNGRYEYLPGFPSRVSLVARL